MPGENRKRRRQQPAEGEGKATGGAHAASHAASHSARPDDDEERLAALVFGGAGSVGAPAPGEAAASSSAASVKPPPQRAAAWNDADDDEFAIDVSKTARLRKLRKSHSETVLSGREYQERAKARLASGGDAGAPSWALAPSERAKTKRRARAGGAAAAEDEEEEEGEEEADAVEHLVRSSGRLTGVSTALPPDTLGVSRLRDANVSDPARAVIQDLAWHKDGGLLLTASLDARLRFFRVDGKKNPRVASVLLPDLPITTAAWSGDGSEVIATGRRPFFYVYDVAGGGAHRIPRLMGREERSLESAVVSPASPSSSTAFIAFLGSSGNVLLASARTKQWAATLKMEGNVRAAAFSRGPTGGAGGAGALDYPDLLTVGTSGSVYTWDLRTLTCRGRHEEEGGSAGTAIAASPTGATYAVGTAAGVVNVYDAATALEARPSTGSSSLFTPLARPTPRHRMLNLTTGISSLTYHPGGVGDMWLAASQRTQDGMRVVHGETGRVFSNWPTSRTPLNYVTAAAFSPRGGYLTVGNDKGRVLLYRLHHYGAV